MVCCYTAVLHLRPTEVIDWFGHVECSHLVCSNVFFLLGFFFFFSFLPLLSHFPFIRMPRVLAGESEQAVAKGSARLCLVNKVGLLQALLSVLLRQQIVWEGSGAAFLKTNWKGDGMQQPNPKTYMSLQISY